MQDQRAPIDPVAARRAMAPFGTSRTLPREAYVSDDVLEWERRNFFERSWICVGRVQDTAAAGTQRAVRVGSEGVLLVRDPSGALRAFFNVCRHRGHELLEPGACTTARVIRCPYHAWVYGLDGSLKGAPRFNEVPDFDPAEYGLVPVPVAEWHGWALVNASGDAPAFEAHVGNLGSIVAPYEPERLVAMARHDYVVQANWKIVVENYHECYHCPSIHPELCQVSPPDSGINLAPAGAWAGGTMDLHPEAETMSMTGESFGVPMRRLDARQRRQVLYFGLFPNLLISLHPDYVMTHRIEPVAPGRSHIECEWLFAPEAPERDDFSPSYASDFWDVVNRQDWSACESVQRGAASRGYRPGPLSPREDAVHRFIAMVAAGYLGVSEEPAGARTGAGP